jgi:DNA-binding MarR family transcriptional regulator
MSAKAPTPAASLSPERVARLDEMRVSFSALLAAERRFRARKLETGDISIAQMRAIMELGRQGSATPGELAVVSDLRPASVTAMLDHLENDGLIERSRDTEDGRRVIVTLTDAGHELLEHKRERWRRFGDETLAELSNEELDTAIRALRALARGIEELDREDRADS